MSFLLYPKPSHTPNASLCEFVNSAALCLQEEEESFSAEQAATSQPTEPQPTPAQAPRKHYRNREHFATIRTASLVRTLAYSTMHLTYWFHLLVAV